MIIFVFHFHKPRDVRATFSIVVGLDDKPTKYEQFKFADTKGKILEGVLGLSFCSIRVGIPFGRTIK